MAYETQFTQENIVDMTTYIQEQIGKYATEVVNKDLDVFVILAALGSVGYNYVMHTLPQDEEQKHQVYNEMKTISDSLFLKMDAHRFEFGTSGISDLAAISHSFSLLSEYYARLRDKSILDLQTMAPAQEEAVNE